MLVYVSHWNLYVATKDSTCLASVDGVIAIAVVMVTIEVYDNPTSYLTVLKQTEWSPRERNSSSAEAAV
jgi:hypothetical protein